MIAIEVKYWFGGEGGIRTPDRAFQPYNGLANRRLQPARPPLHLRIAVIN